MLYFTCSFALVVIKQVLLITQVLNLYCSVHAIAFGLISPRRLACLNSFLRNRNLSVNTHQHCGTGTFFLGAT